MGLEYRILTQLGEIDAHFLRLLQKEEFQINTLETLSEIWNSKNCSKNNEKE